MGNQATILTLGANARGILAQSIGGGGGVGGSATAIAFRSATQIGLSLGGAGGTGAASGNVGVDNGARITTVGDDAEAVLAQSIGGGGGIGGMVNVIGLQIGGVKSGTDQTTVNLAVGGTGGTGAVAGGVTANNSGRIITVGERSYGIRAESIGGGGGSGGAVINARLQGSGQSTGVDINIGGTGGTGAAAGAVNVTNSGRVETLGTEAAGIVATSVGGGGGSGGLVLDMLFGTSGGEKTQQFKLNVGGSGGTGGTGGDVSVVNGATGSIQTWGDKAYGILAQSIGGGGGRGSSVISATGMAASEQSMILGLSLGGVGGSGNNAGDVHVSNAGTITTSGDDAHGIFAQSIGGGGGTGGMALAGVISGSAAKSTHTFAIGGIGGTGADAGAVTVTNTGSIVTYGARSDGIRAQSIGGGGGDANVGLMLGTSVSGIGGNLFNGLLGAIGGGAGGAGGPVTVNQSGSITVYGANAQAISAASINGGGGSLTFDLSGITDLVGTPLDPAGELRSTIMAVLGGENTSDANSTAVTINAVGNQAVVGAGGSGTGVQSVGGGGGTAYLNLNFVPTSQSTTLRSRSTLQSTMAIAPTVAVAPAAMAAAVPAAAPVLLSDLVIGLGGTGGNGNGGAPITVSLDGEILTAGTDTPGQLHQTIGGGGGRAVAALDVSAAAPGAVIATLGATDTVNSSGGTINAVQTGRVITSGDIAPGAMLQSIGGGGGTVGVYLSAGSPVGPIADLTLGADGGSGLDGGAITASYSGGISTTGDLSAGLLVQSIGAGGGNVRLSQIGANTIVIGGANGATGSGGSIEIFNNGQIATFGARSHAVMLQSIGGGGGAVFGTDLGGVVSRSGAIGDGGAISFAQTGDIVADGEGSRGVIAQSIGGGGGYVEGLFAGSAGGQGSGGSIDLTLGGSVLATALDGTAVFAQSVGDAGGNITIGVTGDVRGGSGAGAGIHLDGGANNFVLSSGSLSAVSQLAALGTTGNDTVENTGRLYGNVMLGSGNNQLLNRAGATFMAASDIQLRTDPSATGLFQNDGLLLMGLSAAQRPIDLAAGDEFPNADGLFDPRQNLFFGSRVVTQTDLAGDLVQTETGHMVYDVAFGPYASDKIRASGDVTVDGTMDVTLTWLENSQSYVMVSTETGATVTDLGLQVTDTLAMDYRVQATSRGIELDFTSHFDQPYLTPNGRAIGKHMNSAIEAGGSGGIGRLSAWMGNLVAGQEQLYGHLMTQVSPEAYLTGIKLHYLGADRFRRQLAEASTSATEGWSWWGSLDLDDFDQKSKVDQYGAKSTGFLTTIGGRGEIGSNLFLSASLGYRRIDSFAVTDGTFTAGAGDAFHMGGMLAWRPESGVELTGSVTAGWQWLHSMRLTDIFEPITAHAKPKASDLQFTMGASYTHRFGAGFFKPAFDLTGTALHQSEFAESGLSGLGMKADSRTQWLWAANPRIVAGVTLQDRGPNRAEVRFKVGGVFQLEDTLAMPYRFIGANPGADPALLTLGLNRNSLMLGGEFVLSHHDRMTFTAGLSHLGGNRDNSLTGSARLTIKF